MKDIRFQCSPEQEEVVADHLLFGKQLGMQPDERAWIRANVQRMCPGARIKAADLDLETAQWVVTVEE